LLASFPHFVHLLLLLHLKNSPSPACFWAPSMLRLPPPFLLFAAAGAFPRQRQGGEREEGRRDRPRGTLQGRPRMSFVTCAATATGIRAATATDSPRLGCSSANLVTRHPFEPFWTLLS
jgi:hypothetical protein